MNLANGEIANLTLQCERSQLDQIETGVVLVWKYEKLGRKWKEKKASLEKDKKILDVEILSISEALKIAE